MAPKSSTVRWFLMQYNDVTQGKAQKKSIVVSMMIRESCDRLVVTAHNNALALLTQKTLI